MTTQILGIILLAAIFHSIWNIILRYCQNSETVSWLQLVFASVWLFPFILCSNSRIPFQALPTLLLSGIMQALYYLFLSKCYQNGNLSVVYPLVRGSAPVFVCLLSLLLGLEHLSLQTVSSLFLIIIGIYIVNMPSLHIKDISRPFEILIHERSTRISILVGVIIALYTIADKQNVKYVDPLIIYYAVTIIPAIILAPYILKRGGIGAELQGIGKFRVLCISFFTFLAYYLVLVAMNQTDATYVSSIREISVLFVVIFISIKNKDKSWPPKIMGAILIFIGIVFTSLSS